MNFEVKSRKLLQPRYKF